MSAGHLRLRLVWDGPFTLLNARSGHWWANAAEDAQLRAWAGHKTTQAGVRFDEPVVIEAVMTSPHKLADCDAIGPPVKHVIDGMVDGGAIPDDSPEWVRSLTLHAPEKAETRTLVVLMRPADRKAA
ncbi:MAG: hypothetical protein AAGA37_19925 [Actinomycetota bacterium]